MPPGVNRFRPAVRRRAACRVETVPMSDQEVPEPDAVEQAQPVADIAGFVEPTLDAEVPEADALEQAMGAPVDEDDAQR